MLEGKAIAGAGALGVETRHCLGREKAAAAQVFVPCCASPGGRQPTCHNNHLRYIISDEQGGRKMFQLGNRLLLVDPVLLL